MVYPINSEISGNFLSINGKNPIDFDDDWKSLISSGVSQISHLCFADDIDLVGLSQEELPKLQERVAVEVEKLG